MPMMEPISKNCIRRLIPESAWRSRTVPVLFLVPGIRDVRGRFRCSGRQFRCGGFSLNSLGNQKRSEIWEQIRWVESLIPSIPIVLGFQKKVLLTIQGQYTDWPAKIRKSVCCCDLLRPTWKTQALLVLEICWR